MLNVFLGGRKISFLVKSKKNWKSGSIQVGLWSFALLLILTEKTLKVFS
jgi:hypothetical protein